MFVRAAADINARPFSRNRKPSKGLLPWICRKPCLDVIMIQLIEAVAYLDSKQLTRVCSRSHHTPSHIPISSIWSIPSMNQNISHFLLCPIPSWGKNYHSLRMSFWLEMSIIRTRQAFLCSCDAPRAWTGKHNSDLHSYSGRTQENQNRDITSIFRRVSGKFQGSPTNQVNT